MIPQTVLIGLVVAVVGYFLQQRSWRNSKREEIRQKEFEECIKLIEALARVFDKRIAATSEFLGLVDSDKVKKEDYDKYKSCVFDWMHEFSTFKSKIFHYFGRSKMADFEYVVHDSLREVSDVILRTHKYGKSQLSSAHKLEHDEVREKMNISRHRAFRFLRELNDMVSNEEIGRTALYNNINTGSLEFTSKIYLLQRLFGLKA
ncbi:hypothetical protein [Pseudotabrizicola alkalilacus]|uniref:hypothetical protein n=1 Tax=Pseudotabrizicola alkalilacus TaxID=2305252 RepID=UPI001313F82C|nr:hypothetical protein [Pseudotabrizicola alkalilacus]